MAQWVFGAGLSALVAVAHAQPAYASHFGGGGFQRSPVASPGARPMARPMSGGAPHGGWGMREASPARRESPSFSGYGVGRGGNGGSDRYGAAPMRVADQGGWQERGGRAGRSGRGDEGQPDRAGGGNYGGGYRVYRNGPITPVSAETRPVPHPPADSPVRAGSIREDVARYNEERGSFRPFPRGGGEVPRPPMPSPYRN